MIALRSSALLILMASLPASGQGNSCPDSHPWTGHVATWSFGFAFDVPKPLKGYWNSPACSPDKDGCTCMGDHGRIIPLGSRNEDRQIEMYGAHFDPDFMPERPEVTSSTFTGDPQPGTIKVTKRSVVLLSGLPAHAFVVKYRDAKSHTEMVQESWVAIRKKRIEYLLYLRSPESSYHRDRRIFVQIVSSFRLTKGEYTQ